MMNSQQDAGARTNGEGQLLVRGISNPGLLKTTASNDELMELSKSAGVVLGRLNTGCLAGCQVK